MSTKYLICCLSMAFALVACGDDSSSGPDQVQSGETTVSSSSEKGDVSSSGTETSEVSFLTSQFLTLESDQNQKRRSKAENF